MPSTPSPESAYLLPEELIQKRHARGLQAVTLVLLAGVPILMAVSVLQNRPWIEAFILFATLAAAGVAQWLLRRGRYLWAGHLLVFSMIACATAGIYAFGSVRSAVVVGFTAAVVTAGMALGKKALAAAVTLSAAALGALTWAEHAGLIGQPDLSVGLRFWLLHAMLLAGTGIGIYSSREVVLRALREQRAELERREQAEHALGISEDRFRRIFRSSPAAIVVQSLQDLTVLDVNPAFERLYGYTRAEILGHTDAVLWGQPEDRKTFQRQMAETGRLLNLPLEARARDGSLIHILLSSEIEGKGDARIVVSTITDATAEMRARQAARQSAELFSKAFDFSPINMTITRVSDGRFLAVNGAEDRVQGFTAAELLGRTSVEVGVWRDDAERQQFIAELRRQSHVDGRDTQMRHKDGSMIDCRMWSVIIDIAGQPCVLSSTINTTDQKRREALLIDMAKGLSSDTGEAFFQSVVQHLGKAIAADLVMVGETTDEQSVNSLAMLEDGVLKPNISYELAGTPCDMAFDQSDVCVYGERLQQLFPQDKILVDGGYNAYIGVALRDPDGSAIGIVNAFWHKAQPASQDRDALVQIFASRITSELVRLRRDREIRHLNETLEQRVRERTEELQATNAELESFGYSVSHDLQSPLRSIEGFTVLLGRRLQGRLSDEELRLFERVRSNVVRMHELITDLLALARASKGQLLLEEVNLSALAQRVVAQLRQRDPRRQVKVQIEPGITARCDSKFARIILENLIGNAWKYSRDQADASIFFAALPVREDGRRMLVVKDNGAGFNMAFSASLFKPFHRLHHCALDDNNKLGEPESCPAQHPPCDTQGENPRWRIWSRPSSARTGCWAEPTLNPSQVDAGWHSPCCSQVLSGTFTLTTSTRRLRPSGRPSCRTPTDWLN